MAGQDANAEKDPVIAAARQLLHKNLKVTLQDGRVLVGGFDCIDKEGNIILRAAHVYRKDEPIRDGAQEAHRNMGMALVPLKQRLAVEVQAMPSQVSELKALLQTK